MNKTTDKFHTYNKSLLRTQTNLRRRHMYSPVRSPKSSSTTEETIMGKQYLSSTNWCIYDSSNGQFFGLKSDQQREVASLTKIMTTLVSLQLLHKYEMNQGVMIRISQSAANHNGTTAQLKEGKYIKLLDLFYGAMLPSGNDAAFLLAEVFGLLLFYENVKPESKLYSEIESIDLTCYDSTTTFINKFLKEMNRKSRQLGLNKTVFSNPHGLPNILNMSTAKDLLILCRYAYKNAIFKEISNCQSYEAKLYEVDMQTTYCIRKWANTNKLLGRGWEGIKTGHTAPAGGCLATMRNGVFTIVLNCANKDARFEDTIMLYDWYQKKIAN